MIFASYFKKFPINTSRKGKVKVKVKVKVTFTQKQAIKVWRGSKSVTLLVF